jgi:hypothetical protein
MKMRFAIVAVICLGLAVPATIEAKTYRVVVTPEHSQDGHVGRIGSWRTFGGTYKSAVHYFGRPTSIRHTKYACRVRWAVGLRIDFLNLGAGPQCVYPQALRITSDRFVTQTGLTVGADSAAILDFYPAAMFDADHGLWSLVSAWSNIGDGGDYTALGASVSQGKVTALNGWIGAAGE